MWDVGQKYRNDKAFIETLQQRNQAWNCGGIRKS